MKLISTRLTGLIFFISTVVFAQETSTITDGTTGDTSAAFAQENNDSLKKIAEYLLHLGAYLGYNLEEKAKPEEEGVSEKLPNAQAMQLVQNYVFNTVIGAIPVNAITSALSQFVPSSSENFQAINSFANYTFSSQPYDSSDQEGGKISISTLIDQQTYQQDPVSQAVLNILTTPDISFCMGYNNATWDADCEERYQGLIKVNVIGELPKPRNFYTYAYNQAVLPQLNSNTLTGPFLYSQEGSSSTSSSQSTGDNKGLTAKNQAQAAANFIRYAIGAVAPIDLPKLADYTEVYNRATNVDGKTSESDQKRAQSAIADYLTSLRVYASQVSVAYSNLYYILSKRMPQNQSATESKPSSQALSEFGMATWRLYNPEQKDNKKQWIAHLDGSSSATVQKEIAVLLAEINYQLYLTRQQQERLLLTNSILLLQNAAQRTPSTDKMTALRPRS